MSLELSSYSVFLSVILSIAKDQREAMQPLAVLPSIALWLSHTTTAKASALLNKTANNADVSMTIGARRLLGQSVLVIAQNFCCGTEISIQQRRTAPADCQHFIVER
jgi:hypothetical protein